MSPRPRDVAIAVALTAVMLGLAVVILLPRGGGGSSPEQASRAAQRVDPPGPLVEKGQLVRSQVLGSGEVEVEHWIRSTEPIEQLSLRVPPELPGAPDTIVAHRVRVDDGQGQGYGPVTIRTDENRYFFSSTRSVHISYVLSGALLLSDSARGRALAQVTHLDVDYAHDAGRNTILVLGARVRSSACAAARLGAAFRPCGNQDGRAWRIDLAGDQRHERVMAQVDLLRP